jgi:hypothetical protein
MHRSRIYLGLAVKVCYNHFIIKQCAYIEAFQPQDSLMCSLCLTWSLGHDESVGSHENSLTATLNEFFILFLILFY